MASSYPYDDDPADDIDFSGDLGQAISAANEGLADSNADVDFPSEPKSDSSRFAASARLIAPIMPINIEIALNFLERCMNSSPRVRYGLGAKVPFFQALPGKDFQSIDCSGFVREAIRLSTSPMVKFPDGSVNQHDWIRKSGYKPCDISEAKLVDGRIRIGFLRPSDSSKGIGHVVLIYNGETLESHGGTGPNHRPWTGTSWQAKAKVYLLR